MRNIIVKSLLIKEKKMIDLSIHEVKRIHSKGVKEWRKNGEIYYSVSIVVDYEAFGENVDEDNNEQFGKNQNSFELSLYAETLEALEFKLEGVNRVIKV
jgi:hypothetical protein